MRDPFVTDDQEQVFHQTSDRRSRLPARQVLQARAEGSSLFGTAAPLHVASTRRMFEVEPRRATYDGATTKYSAPGGHLGDAAPVATSSLFGGGVPGLPNGRRQDSKRKSDDLDGGRNSSCRRLTMDIGVQERLLIRDRMMRPMLA